MTEQRSCFAALVLDCHCGERGGYLLARRRNRVHLAGVGHLRHLVR